MSDLLVRVVKGDQYRFLLELVIGCLSFTRY